MSLLIQNAIMQDPFAKMNCSLVENAMFNTTVKDISFERNAILDLRIVTIVCEVVVSVVVVLLAYDAVGKNIKFLDTVTLKYCETIFSAKNVLRAVALVMLSSFFPLMSVILLIAFSYKSLCSVLIKQKDDRFVKYLDSFDVFWCLEDDASKSIINVLGIIEAESSQDLVHKIKEKLLMIPHDKGTEKIFYRRKEDYGFYYWRKHKRNSIDLDDYVDVVEIPIACENVGQLEARCLEELMSQVCNHPLPYNDEGLFQIIVTKDRVSNSTAQRGEYAIIFRVHHSVGDGLALIEFLCKALADPTEHKGVLFPMLETVNNRKTNTFQNLIGMIKTLIEMPICLVDGILRKPDDNSLHGSLLKGRKIFKWKDSNENLFQMIKDIKKKVVEYNFSDILATALSKGLQHYFTKTANNVPEEIAVIVPVRFPKNTNKGLHLENDFSVTILDLPTKSSTRLEDVRRRCQQLRESADPLTNHYLLKIIAGVLPNAILRLALNSNQASMVFSNMPGPETLSICGGNQLKKMLFFVPNKGTTGVGVTALCYGGVLRLSAMADAALVSSSDDLALILDGMEAEIIRLHRQYVGC